MSNLEVSMFSNVLFVDDDATILRMGADLMGEFGFAVTIASCPLKALSIMKDAVGIAIAILDYQMPIMNGCLLADCLRSMCPGLKIILHSGAIEIPQSEMKNVDAFVSKGDGMRQLLSQVFEFAQAGLTSSQ